MSIKPITSRRGVVINEKLLFQQPHKSARSYQPSQKKAQTIKEVLFEDYANDIETYIMSMENVYEEKKILAKHNITHDYRGKMVDWMGEVLNTFSCSDQTFFLAVQIMDRYFQKTEKTLNPPDLHLVGLTSMFIASKYEDIVPILMKTLIQKIGHEKFSLAQIQIMELEILQTLQF